MQTRQNRLFPIGATDFDSVMFFGPILGPENMQTGVFSGAKRHAGGYDMIQRAERFKMRGGGSGIDQRQRILGGKGRAIGDRDDNRGRQQTRGFA